MSKDDRKKLFPNFGTLFPEGHQRLAQVDDVEQVRNAVDVFPLYRRILAQGNAEVDKLDDAFFEYEVSLNKRAFDCQFGLGVFYAYVKLREQEVRNIVWIAECISQKQKQKANNIITIF